MPASSRIRHGLSSARSTLADDNENKKDDSPDASAVDHYLRGFRSSRIAAGKSAGRAYRNTGEMVSGYHQRKQGRVFRNGQTDIRTDGRWHGRERQAGRNTITEDIQIKQPKKDSGRGLYVPDGSMHRRSLAGWESRAGLARRDNAVTVSPGPGRRQPGGKTIRTSYAAYAPEPEGRAYVAGRNLLIRKYAKDALVIRNGARQKMNFARGKIAEKIKKVFGRLRKGLTATRTLLLVLTTGSSLLVTVLLVCILFGAAFYMFGDTSANSCMSVSAEVEAYEPLIRQYAQQYGIGEYVQLIKAIMMQESTGLGSDPMMASESGYNRKYPHKPGAITDPFYSIECGVQTIRDALVSAACENPVDMEHIRLALQGYNYGNGYIDWAIKRDGGYTVENAAYFSDMMAKKMGWEGYGDRNYVSNVLRFYPYGRYNYGIGNSVIIKVAAAQVGNRGGQPYWSWYGFGSRVDWCAIFVSWCGSQCGYLESGILPRFSVVSEGVSFFKEKGQWQPGSYTPAPGDIIFFNWDGDIVVDHVGIVESFDGTYVHTIEGNSGDVCRRQQYLLGEGCITGYGVPKY